MKMLVTGAAGFLGSYISEKYVKEGHLVLGLDNFMNGSLNNIRELLAAKNFKLLKGDTRKVRDFEQFMSGVDVIFHCAAQIHVDRSIVEPHLTFKCNVLGTLNILELARKFDVKTLIHLSSSEVYGSALYVPIDEKHPLNAPHPYGASKIAADRLCFAYHKTYGIDVRIVRCFNIYGPRQKDSGYGGVISIFVRRVLENLPPIIYGSGEQTRDYMYIRDSIEGLDSILKAKHQLSGEVINLGTGVEISILNLAKMIISLLGKENELKPVHVAARPGEVQRLCADITKARELLGFKPKYAIGDGLTEFIEWYRRYKSYEWEKPG